MTRRTSSPVPLRGSVQASRPPGPAPLQRWLVGTVRQTRYLRSNPLKDVTRFGGDILFPVLVRDAEALGIYAALGIDPDATGLKGPRLDIINTINLGRPIPIQDGFTGDVITLDAALDSQFPNGRRLDGNPIPNREHVDVSDVLISLVLGAIRPHCAGDGVNSNDKNYLTVFPFVPLPLRAQRRSTEPRSVTSRRTIQG